MKINRHTLAAIAGFAALLQVIIILYNNMTGFVPLSGFLNFVVRVAFGTALSFPVAVAAVAVDMLLIRRMEQVLSWQPHIIMRALIEAIMAVVAGALLGVTLTVLAHALSPYREGLLKSAINNAIITGVVNLIIITVLEAVEGFRRAREAERKAESLERENAEIRFHTLKTQLNPHFLFNSLNVLSSLVGRDGKRAQHFIDEFSSVYRYILEVIDQPVVELSRELQFARSYLYLMEIRFENAVKTEVNVPTDNLDALVPPLSIQILLENAFKHNKASEESPLIISLATEGNTLIVRNTLQPKQQGASGGIGLANLSKRYALLGESKPSFAVRDNEFVAVLPLIKAQ